MILDVLVEAVGAPFSMDHVVAYLEAQPYTARDAVSSDVFLLAASSSALAEAQHARVVDPVRFPTTVILVELAPARIHIAYRTAASGPARRFAGWLMRHYAVRFLDEILLEQPPDLDALFGPQAPDEGGAAQLAWLESEPDLTRVVIPSTVDRALAELLAIQGTHARCVLLYDWMRWPSAFHQLVRVIAENPTASRELAPAVLATALDDDDANAILATAYPMLGGAYREAAADRLGLSADALAPPRPEWQWPAGKPFPPWDSVEGVQARLNYLAFGAGPVDGQWTDRTQRAFVRWQVLNGHEPTGELDYLAQSDLGASTPDAPE